MKTKCRNRGAVRKRHLVNHDQVALVCECRQQRGHRCEVIRVQDRLLRCESPSSMTRHKALLRACCAMKVAVFDTMPLEGCMHSRVTKFSHTQLEPWNPHSKTPVKIP